MHIHQKVHLLGMRKTIEEHTPKGAKNTFGTLQNKNVPFGVFLHQNHKKFIFSFWGNYDLKTTAFH
ncbi:hypothetical protein CN671_19770 [Bacillus toyonensis]|nr:hypothetical protein CN671_19770 [Bacillus toyonensis]